MRRDSEKWEASWASDLDSFWKDGVGDWTKPGANFSQAFGFKDVLMWTREENLGYIQSMSRCVCALQDCFGHDVASRSMLYDFDTEWMTASDADRRKVALEGICRAMADDDLLIARRWCPDSTLNHLISEHGETYLQLMRLVLPQDLANLPVTPNRIPHPAVDRHMSMSPTLASIPGYRGMATMLELGRIQCMTRIIREIFLAFVRSVVHICLTLQLIVSDPSTNARRSAFPSSWHQKFWRSALATQTTWDWTYKA